MARATQFHIVLVTCGSIAEARRIALAIVKKRLAACVNILTAPLESVYTWKDKVEKAREYLLIIKTSTKRLRALEREVLRLHSYETPEFVVLRVSGGCSAYLSWLARALTK
jgi:periplasmic divalent cation tolerance protein